jgi:hypothetical protein
MPTAGVVRPTMSARRPSPWRRRSSPHRTRRCGSTDAHTRAVGPEDLTHPGAYALLRSNRPRAAEAEARPARCPPWPEPKPERRRCSASPKGGSAPVDGDRRRSPPKRRLRGERPRCSNVSRVRQLSQPRRSVALTWARRPADVRCPVDLPPKRQPPRPARIREASAPAAWCGGPKSSRDRRRAPRGPRQHEAAATRRSLLPRAGWRTKPHRKPRCSATASRVGPDRGPSRCVTVPHEHADPTPKRRGDEASDLHATIR